MHHDTIVLYDYLISDSVLKLYLVYPSILDRNHQHRSSHVCGIGSTMHGSHMKDENITLVN